SASGGRALGLIGHEDGRVVVAHFEGTCSVNLTIPLVIALPAPDDAKTRWPIGRTLPKTSPDKSCTKRICRSPLHPARSARRRNRDSRCQSVRHSIRTSESGRSARRG